MWGLRRGGRVVQLLLSLTEAVYPAATLTWLIRQEGIPLIAFRSPPPQGAVNQKAAGSCRPL